MKAWSLIYHFDSYHMVVIKGHSSIKWWEDSSSALHSKQLDSPEWKIWPSLWRVGRISESNLHSKDLCLPWRLDIHSRFHWLLDITELLVNRSFWWTLYTDLIENSLDLEGTQNRTSCSRESRIWIFLINLTTEEGRNNSRSGLFQEFLEVFIRAHRRY